MLRLTVKARSSCEAVMAVDGRIGDGDVGVLRREVGRLLEDGVRLTLELGGVQSIDEAGLALLKSWSAPRVALRGGSAYLRALFEAEGLELR